MAAPFFRIKQHFLRQEENYTKNDRNVAKNESANKFISVFKFYIKNVLHFFNSIKIFNCL